MRLGADPDQLDRLADLHDTCAAQLTRVRVQVRSVDRRSWTGPSALRWWAHLDRSIVPLLTLGGERSTVAARTLRAAATAQRLASLPDPQRRTVWSDSRGDGRWVGRIGPGDAEVVVVLVPGVGTDGADAPVLGADAERVWATLAARAGAATSFGAAAADRVAVLSWLGYDPPDHVLGGVDPRAAAVGARQLARDVAELRRTGASRVVAVGHSYGALVVAGAVRDGVAVDELVALGAPGLGVDGLHELRLADGVDLWVARARRDPIAAVARFGIVHGTDPVRLGRSLPTSRPGHGSYLSDPVLLDALARVALGER